jgi:hypothetical protein
MSTPSYAADFPAPHSTQAGPANTASESLGQAAKAYVPKGTNLEQPGATLSRFALRLVDRATGKAYSADELATHLADGGLAAGSSIVTTTKTVAGGVLAIPITHRYVAKTTGGAEALTLANGAFVGQRLNIRLVTDGGDGTLTPTTKVGFATIVFSAAGHFAELEWTTSGWIIVGLGGLTAQPVVTA